MTYELVCTWRQRRSFNVGAMDSMSAFRPLEWYRKWSCYASSSQSCKWSVGTSVTHSAHPPSNVYRLTCQSDQPPYWWDLPINIMHMWESDIWSNNIFHGLEAHRVNKDTTLCDTVVSMLPGWGRQPSPCIPKYLRWPLLRGALVDDFPDNASSDVLRLAQATADNLRLPIGWQMMIQHLDESMQSSAWQRIYWRWGSLTTMGWPYHR